MKHGCMVMTLRLSSSHHSGIRQIHHGWKKHKFAAMSSTCYLFFQHPRHCPKEFVLPAQTINGKFYCEVLKRLREGIRRKCPDNWKKNNWFLHHDNVPAHTSLVRQLLTSKNITIPRPPYLPDLAPATFPYSPKMKLRLKGRRFDMTEEIHTEMQEIINTLTFENFQGCMKSWETCWDRCIHAQGTTLKGQWKLGVMMRNFFLWSNSPNFLLPPCMTYALF